MKTKIEKTVQIPQVERRSWKKKFDSYRSQERSPTLTQEEKPVTDYKNMSPDVSIVKEILFTEQDYVDDLKVIIEVFMGGIQKDGCVTKEEMTLIFPNLQLLYGVNCQLLELLKKKTNLQRELRNPLLVWQII